MCGGGRENSSRKMYVWAAVALPWGAEKGEQDMAIDKCSTFLSKWEGGPGRRRRSSSPLSLSRLFFPSARNCKHFLRVIWKVESGQKKAYKNKNNKSKFPRFSAQYSLDLCKYFAGTPRSTNDAALPESNFAAYAIFHFALAAQINQKMFHFFLFF